MDRIELDRFAWGIIRREACQMVGRAGLTRDDHDDLVQELALRLWKSSRRFDPAQAHWKSFVTAVVERHVIQILRDRAALKRDGGPCEPLAAEGGPADRASDPARTELALDVAAVLDGLPEDLPDLAGRLMTQSLSEAARDLGVARSSLQRRIGRIRRLFEDAGLNEIR
jgi:RNA polymerase sigma factor (sigma-70 family)